MKNIRVFEEKLPKIVALQLEQNRLLKQVMAESTRQFTTSSDDIFPQFNSIQDIEGYEVNWWVCYRRNFAMTACSIGVKVFGRLFNASIKFENFLTAKTGQTGCNACHCLHSFSFLLLTIWMPHKTWQKSVLQGTISSYHGLLYGVCYFRMIHTLFHWCAIWALKSDANVVVGCAHNVAKHHNAKQYY